MNFIIYLDDRCMYQSIINVVAKLVGFQNKYYTYLGARKYLVALNICFEEQSI